MKAHWEQIYQTKAANNVSWYQQKPELSLSFLQKTDVSANAHIIDVGAGASTLADHLLALGFHNLTLLDISKEALQIIRNRLSTEQAGRIDWLVGDITEIHLPQQTYDLWHDRAVFHFLIDPAQRRRYFEQVERALKPGGHLILTTLASDGPSQCSGLDVMRYDAASLHREFGAAFQLVESSRETHMTPWSREQRFIYCWFRRDPAPAESS